MKKTIQALLMLVLVIGFGTIIAQTPTTKAVTDSTQKVGDTLKVDSLTLDSLAQADSVAMADSLAKAEAMMTPEQKLCREVAEDIMAIYKREDITSDYNMLLPTIRKYVAEYKSMTYSDDLARTRATTNLKDKIYAEVNRITEKKVYFGYIRSDLSEALKQSSAKITKYIYGRKNELTKQHEQFVAELLVSKNGLLQEVDSLKAELKKPEIAAAQKLLHAEYSEKYSNAKALKNEVAKLEGEELKPKMEEMNKIQVSLDSLKGLLLTEQIAQKIKRSMRKTKEWVEAKNRDVKDLYSDESERLSQVVMSYIQEEGQFDIGDAFAQAAIEDKPELEMLLKNNIKYKFMNDIVNKFSFFLKYNTIEGYRGYRTNVLIFILLFMVLFFYTLFLIKKKKESLFIRRIPGLDAIDDAVGRATEMGKPIIYDSGLGAVTDMDTIASMLILKHVAKTVAEFKAEIYFPSSDPIVMQTAEEMISSGFLDAGCPEDHKKENSFYLAGSQFAFAAGLAGLISRKKPATCLHFGYYAAESLLISEAGFNAGAIQVAGTSAVDQVPFFVAACDYTLIGEEIYAAAAYLSREPQIMTNLKVSDYAKVAFVILFIAGTIMLTINPEWTFLLDLFETH